VRRRNSSFPPPLPGLRPSADIKVHHGYNAPLSGPVRAGGSFSASAANLTVSGQAFGHGIFYNRTEADTSLV